MQEENIIMYNVQYEVMVNIDPRRLIDLFFDQFRNFYWDLFYLV